MTTSINHELDGYTAFYKKNRQLMKPWTPKEDMSGVSVTEGLTPEIGGMIAIDEYNPIDKWYIAKDFFTDNYRI